MLLLLTERCVGVTGLRSAVVAHARVYRVDFLSVYEK